MTSLVLSQLAPPSRESVTAVLDFANSERPSETWITGWTEPDLQSVFEENLWWTIARRSLQGAPACSGARRSKRNHRQQHLRVAASITGYRFFPINPDLFFPQSSDLAAISESQGRLRTVLNLLTTANEVTPRIEAELKKPLRNMKLKGSVIDPRIEIQTLDQWWAFPLAALSDEIVGRLSCCAFEACDNYFVDWQGRRGGIRRKYCSKRHERAQNAREVRKRKREEKEHERRETKKLAERKSAKAATMRKKRQRDRNAGPLYETSEYGDLDRYQKPGQRS